MALRRLDLRGFAGDRHQLADVLPRPVDEQDRSSEAVAAIIAEVRAGGDDALRALTARFDGVAVDELRVPADEIRAALARVPPALQEALDVAHDRILAYHAHEVGDVRRRLHLRRRHRAPRGPSGGPGRLLRTGWSGPVPVDRAHVRRPRARGRGRGDRAVRPPGSRRPDRRRHAGRRRRGRGRRGLPGGRGPGHRRHGLRHREHRRRRRHRRPGQPVRGRGQTPGVRRGRRGRRRSPAPPRWWWSPARTRRPSWRPSTWWSRPSTVPTAWPGWSRGRRTRSAEVDAAVDRIVAASPRRADLEATLGAGGCAVLVDGPKQACAVANVVAPEHLEILTRERRVAPRPHRARPARCSSGPTPRPASATTSPDPTTCCPPTARRGSPAPCGSTTSASTSTPSAWTPVPSASWPPRRHPGRDRGTAGPRRSPCGSDGRGGGGTRGRRRTAVPIAAGGPSRPRGRWRATTRPRSTSTSGSTPTSRRSRRRRGGRRRWPPPWPSIDFNRYPDREATELRRPWPASHGVGVDEVFCANGSNEVLQCLLLAYGGAGRTVAAVRADLRPARATSPGSPARRWPPGARRDDFALDLDDVARRGGRGPIRCSPSCARPTTRPAGPTRPRRSPRWPALVPGLLVVDEAYGQFAPSSALELRRGDPRRARRVVVVRTFSKTWSMAAARLGYLVADPEVVRACELVALPYHLDAVTQAGRSAGPRLRRTR